MLLAECIGTRRGLTCSESSDQALSGATPGRIERAGAREMDPSRVVGGCVAVSRPQS